MWILLNAPMTSDKGGIKRRSQSCPSVRAAHDGSSEAGRGLLLPAASLVDSGVCPRTEPKAGSGTGAMCLLSSACKHPPGIAGCRNWPFFALTPQ